MRTLIEEARDLHWVAFLMPRLTAIRSVAADDPESLRPLDATHLRYDGRGLLIEASSRAARIVLERDGNGRIVAETTNGRRVESRLDGLGRRIERRIGAGGPGASLVQIGRDPLGALASLTIDDHTPLAVDLTGWLWTGLIERISQDRKSRTCGEDRRRARSRWC